MEVVAEVDELGLQREKHGGAGGASAIVKRERERERENSLSSVPYLVLSASGLPL